MSENASKLFLFGRSIRTLRGVAIGVSLIGTAVFSTAGIAAAVDYESEILRAVPRNTALAFDGPVYVRALEASDITDGVGCAPDCPDNGTTYQLSYGFGFGGSVFISAEADVSACDPSCKPFDLYKMDVAEASLGAGPTTLLFVPYYPELGDMFQFVTDGVIDGPGGQPDFETIVFPDTFRDLAYVGIIAATPYLGVGIDNIVTSPLPLPTLTPLGMGALALSLCICAGLTSVRARNVESRESNR